MYLAFREQFDLPVAKIFPYFTSPAEWAKLYGAVRPTKVLRGEWYAVPLQRFPFPLMAKNVEFEHEKRVRWIFGGFWRGVGEVNFLAEADRTVVEGFECITPHGLWAAAPLFEKRFMEKEFARIWSLGWKRIRKNQ